MDSSGILSKRSWLVDAANRVLPAAWSAGMLPRPELDDALLLENARTKTGLSDFGDEWFRAPLKVLVAALREEADLNNLGRFGAAGQIAKMLRDRLWTQAWLSEQPEIGRRSLARPVFVVGPMRSGTTRLHRLLAADDRFAHMRMFEAIAPVTEPGRCPGRFDRRRLEARAILGAVHRFNPNTAIIHPTGPLQPEEELGLLVASFWGMKHEAQWNVPGYGAWSVGRDATPAYRHMALLLKLVGWMRGDDDQRPWVLKTPQHMLDLPALTKVFPDARIVFTHRDPQSVVASSSSLVWNQKIIHSDSVDPRTVGREWFDKTHLQIESMRAARRRIPESRRIDVNYEDVDADWQSVMRRIYRFLDMDMAPALPAMQAYVQRTHHSSRLKRHRYSLDAFGLDAGVVKDRFADYVEAFELGARPSPQPRPVRAVPGSTDWTPAAARSRIPARIAAARR